MKTVETLLGLINPAAVPALRIAGALFLIIYWSPAPTSSATGVDSLVATRALMVTVTPFAIYASNSF